MVRKSVIIALVWVDLREIYPKGLFDVVS